MTSEVPLHLILRVNIRGAHERLFRLVLALYISCILVELFFGSSVTADLVVSAGFAHSLTMAQCVGYVGWQSRES